MNTSVVDRLALRLTERRQPPALQPAAKAPAAEACSARDLCVVLHDVSPARWEGCRRVVAELERCATQAGVRLPLTLLVVPHMHGDTALPAPYLRWLYDMQRAGHELALHGLTHCDEGPPPRGLRERLLRQVYTAGEGEFAALSHAEAVARLRAGRAWLRALGLGVQGFVAPAWLMSPGSLQAVADAGFGHTCTLTEVIALPHGQALAAPSLVFSTRAAWRRWLSLLWNLWLARRSRHARLLRLELHPADADFPAVRRCWSGLLRDALVHRVPLRLAEAAVLARRL
ncbi:MAG TPA: polysaccharide deacetylase family protein [Roseateles sp.]